MATTPFPQYERPSGWNALLPPAPEPRLLEGDVTADAVVIGAGYTGVAAARRWATERPEDDVIVLESSRVGEGNPGRNSGFLLEISLANDADASQVERMHDCNELIARTMNRMRDDVFDRGRSIEAILRELNRLLRRNMPKEVPLTLSSAFDYRRVHPTIPKNKTSLYS